MAKIMRSWLPFHVSVKAIENASQKHGILNPIRMGNRIFYKKQDILDVLEQQKINKKR